MSTITKDVQRSVNLYCQGNTQGALEVLKKYDKEPEIKSIFDRFQTEQGKPVLGNLSEPELAGKISAVLSGQAPAPEDEEMSAPEISTTTASSTCSATTQDIATINHCPEDVFQIIFSNSDLRVIILCRSVSQLWQKFATMSILCKVIPEKERYVTCVFNALDNKFKATLSDIYNPLYSKDNREICISIQLTNSTSFIDLTNRVSNIQFYMNSVCGRLSSEELYALQDSLKNENFSLFFNDIIFVKAAKKEINEIRSNNELNNKSGKLTDACLKLCGRKQFKRAIETTKNEDISFSKTQALAVYTSIVRSLMNGQSINGDDIDLVIEICDILREKFIEAKRERRNDFEIKYQITVFFNILLQYNKFKQTVEILTKCQDIENLKAELLHNTINALIKNNSIQADNSTKNNTIQTIEEIVIAFKNDGDEMKHEFLARCLQELAPEARLELLSKIEGKYSKVKMLDYLTKTIPNFKICEALIAEIANKISEDEVDESALEAICIRMTIDSGMGTLLLFKIFECLTSVSPLLKARVLYNIAKKLYELDKYITADWIRSRASEMALKIPAGNERKEMIEKIKELDQRVHMYRK